MRSYFCSLCAYSEEKRVPPDVARGLQLLAEKTLEELEAEEEPLDPEEEAEARAFFFMDQHC